MQGPIFALNPNVPHDKMAAVAEWCNEHGYDHYRLLYAAASLGLEGLVYRSRQEKMELLGAAVYGTALTDRHRFLAVTLALKALISAYRLPVIWLSEYAVGNPAVSQDEINNLALACRRRGLEPWELLDTALCRAGVEELLADGGDGGETARLNCDLLIEAADAGKIIGRELRDQPLEDRVGMLLKITRAMCGNILGKCGRAN